MVLRRFSELPFYIRKTAWLISRNKFEDFQGIFINHTHHPKYYSTAEAWNGADKRNTRKAVADTFRAFKKKELPVSDICILTRAMCEVARQLQNQSGDVQGWLASVQLSAKELADICAGQYARVRPETDRKKSEYLDSSS